MTLYDITAQEIRTLPPDVVNVDELQPGDKIGYWAETWITADGAVTPMLFVFVASIQPYKRFKVYMDWGDTSDIMTCASHGKKVRGEWLARQIFPLLTDYDFMEG